MNELPYQNWRNELNQLLEETKDTPAALGGSGLYLEAMKLRILLEIADDLNRIGNALDVLAMARYV